TIWRTFWILLIITCVELTIGMFIAPHFNNYKIFFNVLYIFLTLIKAFYIVAEFMHLRHELKNLMVTIVVPLFLFLWFIAAFLWDGNSYRNLRNDYDPYKKEQNNVKGPKQNDKVDESTQHGGNKSRLK
ncbi:MAG: cytochrome C oxidase subunit IV family protein, partial [Chitinophagaceae bacterium]